MMRVLGAAIAVLALTLLAAAPLRAAGHVHVVQEGQTLGGIAKRYGVSIADICETNGISRSAPIRIGQELTIPKKGASKRARSTKGRTHVVQKGQTLGAIAKRYGVSIRALTAANGIRNSSLIREGQELVVPRAGQPVPVALRTHEVASGHTLGKIARRYGVTIDALARANGIKRSAPIRIGQKLVIPDASDEDGSRARAAVRSGKASVLVKPKRQSEPDVDHGAQRLAIPGAVSAYYYEPTGPGRRGLRPVLMYLHGRGAYPGHYCARWAKVVRRFGWLVCPVGPENRGGGKRGWGNNWVEGRRIVKASLQALRKKYGRRVQLYGNTIIGFSEGAFIAMNVGLHEPRAFNRWLILAADTDYWTKRARDRLMTRARSRIRRVYLITGRRDMVYSETRQVRRWLLRAGVPVRISTPQDMGHTVALESKPSMYKAALRWLERG